MQQSFSHFVVASTRCIINAMDLKFFNMLLKVDQFEGFLMLMHWCSLVQVNVTVTITT